MLARLVLSSLLSVVAPASAREPVGVPFPAVLHALEIADTAAVLVLGDSAAATVLEDSLAGDSTRFGRRITARSGPDRAWRRRAIQLLSDVGLYMDHPRGMRRLYVTRHRRYVFEFPVEGDTLRAYVNLAEPRIEIWDRDGLAGRGFPDATRWDALAGLVRRAFPSRPELQRIRVVPPVRDRYVFVDSLPQVLDAPGPEYPAREVGVQGTVLIQALVGTDGRVKEARILHSVPMLDDAALAAVRRWRFRPALSGGRPVAAWVAVPVEFVLH